MNKKKSNPKKTTIYTIAEELQINPGTVSRALRNSPVVSINLRKLIRQRADELNFTLRKFEPRVNNICALIETSNKSDEFFSYFINESLAGMWDYCKNNDLELSIYSETFDRLNSCDLLRILGRRGINGVVTINARQKSGYFKSFHDQKFPYASLMTGPIKATPWTFQTNSEELCFDATQHLIQRGYKRIAYLDTLSDFSVGSDRMKGYLHALQKNKISEDSSLIIKQSLAPTKLKDGYDFGSYFVEKLLSFSSPPTAFITMNNEVAIGALHQLKAAGISVPQKAALLSFDNARFCEFASPPLSTIDIPYRKIASAAAACVHQRIEKGFSFVPATTLFPGELLLRKSTL